MHGSTGFTRKLLLGDYMVINLFPPRKLFHVAFKSGEKRIDQVVATEYFVDVQDVVRLHSIGLLDESVQSERVFLFATTYNWTDVLAVLHKLRADIQLPEPPPNEQRDLTEVVPSKRAGELSRSFSTGTGLR